MVAARRLFEADYLLEYGLRVVGHGLVGANHENHLNFKAAYGVSPRACVALWQDMWDSQHPEITIGPGASLDHFFWCLHFIRAYPLERNMAGYLRANRRGMMRRVKEYVTMISLMKDQKIKLPRVNTDVQLFLNLPPADDETDPNDAAARLDDNDNNNDATEDEAANLFFLTVDGTDCPINEPTPFNRNWMSHKFKGPAIKYEIGVSLEGDISWVSTPYRGSVHDSTIFRRALRLAIPEGYCVIVDSAYGQQDDKVAPVTDYDDKEVAIFKKRALARHETCNKRLKDFKVTSHHFRHGLPFHSVCFNAVAVACQYNIENGEPLFDLA